MTRGPRPVCVGRSSHRQGDFGLAQHNVDPAAEQAWREVLMGAHHSRLGLLPGTHRCRMCRIPLAGIGSVVTKPLGYHPSRKSPHLCNV